MDIVIVQLGEQPPKPPRRTRKSMQKSRLGCITCKIRHVKCDEGKPDCLRCTSIGRDCGGYPSPSKTAHGKSSISSGATSDSQTPERQLVCLPGSPKERRAIEFFYHRTAPQLSGLFSHSFWGRFVLQLSICEPAIRHAMIAVSSIHEATEDTYSTGPIDIHDEKAKFAFVSYSNAIHFLIEEVQRTNDEESLRVLLTTCLILICAELMRGNIVRGITHIESGVKILQNWLAKRTIGSKNTIEEECIETQLVPYFAALNIVNSMLGRPSNGGIYSMRDEDIQYIGAFEFRDIVEARNRLFDILNVGLNTIQPLGEAPYWIEATEEQKIEQLRVIASIEEWNIAFEDLAKRRTPSWTPTDIGGADLLRATQLTTKLWLWTAFSPNETEWDKYKAEYEKLLEISERLVKILTKREKHNLPFSFELGCIPPLHFIAWKCRWPLIRRRALLLLDICQRRECLFDSRFSYSVFRRIMQVEEESFGLPPGQAPRPNDLPPEEARIHQMNISLEGPWREVIPVNLLSKPDGLLGEWHVRREYIQVGKPEIHKSTSTSQCNDFLEEIEGGSPDCSPHPPDFVWTASEPTLADMPVRSRNLANLSRVNVPLSEALVGNAIQSIGVFHTDHTIDSSSIWEEGGE